MPDQMRRGEAGQCKAREVGRPYQPDERRAETFDIGAKRNEGSLDAVAREQNAGGGQERDKLAIAGHGEISFLPRILSENRFPSPPSRGQAFSECASITPHHRSELRGYSNSRDRYTGQVRRAAARAGHGSRRGRAVPAGQATRSRGSLPAKKASRLSRARKPMASRVSAVAEPIWGSRKVLGNSL
ncbi:hypothetical protein BMS3Bbin10_02052 [bacterium BMS3Bbin10]|nr:hypothetical protein BMS3Bbin10_02052 [bacterium BMS3Bbin10]